MGGKFLYFGCGDQAGHYLFEEGARAYKDYSATRAYSHFDGTLPPQPERDLYVASFSVLGGWNACALSWWDRSQDKRDGSNSTVFAPGLNWTPAALLTEAQKRLPWVFSRLPQPLVLHASIPSEASAGNPPPDESILPETPGSTG